MLISYAGILIFTGLTIYDTQSIKRLALTYHSRATDEGQKIAIMGALTLYLDFINIFIYLLRLFGDEIGKLKAWSFGSTLFDCPYLK